MRVTATRLVGRDRELTGLVKRVEDLSRGRGDAVLLEGDPGIGKTTLLKSVTALADARVCWGAGDELGRVLPLQPLVDALGTSRNELLGTRGDAAGSDLVAAVAEHLIERVEKLCADGPVVLVVDELQWADSATVVVWRRLSALVAQLPLLLMGAARPIPQRDDLIALRRMGVHRVRLNALPAAPVAELLAHIVGGTPDKALRRLAAGAGGNPMYVVELAEALVRSGSVEVVDGTARLVKKAPDSLSSAIADRLGFVSQETRTVLTAAALLGQEFRVSDLAVVQRLRVSELLPSLQEAIAAGVLIDSEDVLAFRHGLVRQAMRDEVPHAVRSAWHLEAARELAEAQAEPERVVMQLTAAEETDSWVVPWLLKHGQEMVAHAPDAATSLLSRVIDANHITVPQRERLLSLLADAYFRAGDHEQAEEYAVAGLALAAVVPVDLHWTLAQCRSHTGRITEALADLERALPGTKGRDRARLLVLAARAHFDNGDLDAAETTARTAFDEATECGDRGTIAWALHVRSIVAMVRNSLHVALPLLDQALAVASGYDGTGDLRMLLQLNRALVLDDLDRREEAVEEARSAREAADGAGNLVRLAQAHCALGQLFLYTGRWDDALVEADLLDDDIKNPMVCTTDHGIAAQIYLHRGDQAAARKHLDAVGEDYDGVLVTSVTVARSLLLEQEGDLAGALDVLRPGVSDVVIDDMLPDVVRLAVRVGDLELARRATGHAAVVADKLDVPHGRAFALHCRGLLEGSAPDLLKAADAYREGGMPPRAAESLGSAAVLLAALGDKTSARAAMTQAIDIYTELGAEWDAMALLSHMREHGVRRGPQVKHRRARHGWDSLTPAEQRITELVVQGLSNQQIGEQLFLSRRTVSTHVSHVLAKLGVRSRTDITRVAVSRGVVPG